MGKKDDFLSFEQELIFEKRYLRGLGMSIGIAAIVLAAISRGWSTAISWFIEQFGISRSFAARFFENEGIMQLEQVLFSVACFTIPFIIAAKSANEKVSELVPFKKPLKKSIIPYTLIGMGFCIFSNFAVNVASSFFEGVGVEYEVTRPALPTGSVGILIYLTATAIVPAIVEEFACRGIVLGLLRPFGDGFAVMCSAIIFGILHGNFEQMPFAFLVGLVLGLIRIKTDSIFVPMAVHFFNNAVSVAVTYLGTANLGDALNIYYCVFMAFMLVAGIIGFIMLKGEGEMSFNPPVSKTPAKRKYFLFFTSPAIIVFMVLELLNSVRYFFV